MGIEVEIGAEGGGLGVEEERSEGGGADTLREGGGSEAAKATVREEDPGRRGEAEKEGDREGRLVLREPRRVGAEIFPLETLMDFLTRSWAMEGVTMESWGREGD